MTTILGLDPGGRETGVVLVRDGRLLDLRVHRRLADEPMADYLTRLWISANVMLANGGDDPYRVAVEGLSRPTPHMGTISVVGLLDTAQVLGAILGRWPTAVVVAPGGNGSGPISAYPEALRPARGAGRGKDQLRHCRSAWDVALAGERMLRARERGIA